LKQLAIILLTLSLLTACSTPYDTYKAALDEKDEKTSLDDKGDRAAAAKKESLKYDFEGSTVRCTTGDFVIEASYLTPEMVDMYYSMFKGGVYKNPFNADVFIIFSMTIDNRGDKPMTYNPRMTLMHVENGEPVQMKDFSSLYAFYELAETEDIEKRMESFRVTCFDTTVTIEPGEKVQKLLVYPRTKETPKSVILGVNNIYTNYKSHTIPLTFQDISR